MRGPLLAVPPPKEPGIVRVFVPGGRIGAHAGTVQLSLQPELRFSVRGSGGWGTDTTAGTVSVNSLVAGGNEMAGLIFTSEPMLTRALAAEIRHAPGGFLHLLAERGGIAALSGAYVERVQCEGAAKIDIVMTLNGGRTVGVEAKLDHQVTGDQIEAEKRAVDDLFLLVLDRVDAGDHADQVRGVITWKEAIECFPGSRVTMTDIDALPPQKVAVERVLRSLTPSIQDILGDEWFVGVGRGGSGMPTITILSPDLSDGRQLRGQVQVDGRGMPKTADGLKFAYQVGIQTKPTAEDFAPADKIDSPPAWVIHLERLRDDVLAGNPDLEDFGVRRNRSANGQSGLGKNKSAIVSKFLPGTSWIACGYWDWSIGPRSEPVARDGLPELARRAATLMQQWYMASVSIGAE